jgi:hypothetical protein
MPPYEQAGGVAGGAPSRLHGAMRAVSRDVLRQLLHARVARRRQPAERAHDDGVEIACETLGQLDRVGGAQSRPFVGLGTADGALAGWYERELEELLLDGRWGGAGERVRARAREEHVQQHTQRVDVGRRRAGPAAHLLGARILGRHRPSRRSRRRILGLGAIL